MRTRSLRRCALVASAAAVLAAGARAEEPARYPIGNDLSAFEAPQSLDASAPPAPQPTGPLTLRDALAAALLGNPELAADAYEIRARDAARLQSAAFPNPTVSVELEDFAGSGEFHGLNSAQTTLLVGQLFELGGKRGARVTLAEQERDLASWDYETRRIDVFVRAAEAFVDVLAAQERLRLADESLALAKSMAEVASRRLRAGVASPAEEIRAGVQVDVASVEREHVDHELETARRALAESWGGADARFERAIGDLERLPPVPSEADLARLLEASPSVARWRTELARREAVHDLALSQRWPDVAVTAGPRRLNGPGDTALVVGVTLPLPLWDRKRGAIEASQYRLAKLAHEERAASVRGATELATARVALRASAEEAEALRTRVLPGTERAVQALRRGYESGRFAQIEVLDAERERLAAREQYLRVLTEAHHNAQRIERLTGVSLEVQP